MKIRRRKYASGKTGWQLDLGLVNGKRMQISCASKEDAEGELARRKAELRRAGELAFSITDEERHRYVACRDRLKAVGASLEQAVDFFLLHAKPAKGAITLRQMIDACIEAKREEGARPRYLGQLKCSANSFADSHGEETMCDQVTALDVTRWLQSNEWAPKTWNVYRGDLRTVYQWAIATGHATINPCEAVKPKRLDDGEIKFLTVDQARSLLQRAAAVRPGAEKRDEKGVWIPYELADLDFRDCLAFVVLGLFCGLRPERELGEMSWDDVKEDVVIVQGERAKSRARRVVDLPVNARAWLKLCPSRDGKILPANFRRKWTALREAVKLLDDWPHDGMRHTFATMHLAHHGDEKRLQILMGHESAELIYKHYRGITTAAEAAKFWLLEPVTSSPGKRSKSRP
jgi:integrase